MSPHTPLLGWVLGLASALVAGSAVAQVHPLDAVGTWPAYGRDVGGTRFSPLAQITPSNVGRIRVAWTFRTGELGQGVKDWKRSAFEATPVLHDGMLYFTTSATDVVAVDAATGTLRWRHESHARRDLHYSDGVSRGVSIWVDPARPVGAACHGRVFAPTLDSRLLALDAATGAPCADFGEQGAIDLLKDVGSTDEPSSEWRNYLVTSPPAILDGRVIVGSSIGDNRAVKEELGVVRAFDAVTGRLAWSWDPIPRDPSNSVWRDWKPGSTPTASAANAWAPLSVDPERHLVYVPTGSASPDFYGGERAGDNRWANSVVALDGATGALRWGRQLVHHDLWDYDLASQPTLADVMHGGRRVPAVIQATKMGFLFTLDRETGEPLFPIDERPVPQDAVPGEQPSPTQPFPSAPPPLVRQTAVTPDDAFGLIGLDKLACRKRIAASRSLGIFQPPSLKDSIMQPGNAGGVNWGGVAFDAERQLALVYTMDLPFIVSLIPRTGLKAAIDDAAYSDYEYARQRGTPYAMRRHSFVSKLGIPCVKPPWGQLTAVDMAHGTIRWQVPLGDTPFIPINLGMPGVGGPIVTASGLTFIGASMDDHLRAFETLSGKRLWEVKLPAGGQATPMTYSVGGRQFLVIAAGGYKADSTRGDYLVAYALSGDDLPSASAPPLLDASAARRAQGLQARQVGLDADAGRVPESSRAVPCRAVADVVERGRERCAAGSRSNRSPACRRRAPVAITDRQPGNAAPLCMVGLDHGDGAARQQVVRPARRASMSHTTRSMPEITCAIGPGSPLWMARTAVRPVAQWNSASADSKRWPTSSGASTLSSSRARCSAPHDGKLHQTSPQP